jgi:hypothetical protein
VEQYNFSKLLYKIGLEFKVILLTQMLPHSITLARKDVKAASTTLNVCGRQNAYSGKVQGL